jgi:hypothetical protein
VVSRYEDQDQGGGEDHDDAHHVRLCREQSLDLGEILLALRRADPVAAEGEKRQATHIDGGHESLEPGLVVDGRRRHGDRHHPGHRKCCKEGARDPYPPVAEGQVAEDQEGIEDSSNQR